MKKAVISTGGHQYIVSEGDVINVELIGEDKKLNFEPLLVIDGDKTLVGTPMVKDVKVAAEVVAQIRGEKVTAIRYKAKKRVKKTHGHKQHLTQLKINKIS